MVKEFRSRATAAGARNVARNPAATGFRAHATRRRATRMAHSSTKVQQLESEFLLGTYAGARPAGVSFVKGVGCKLFDAEGREYLDFTSGIAVNCLGHSDEEWTSVVGEQLRTLVHVSNLYSTEPAAVLAKEH